MAKKGYELTIEALNLVVDERHKQALLGFDAGHDDSHIHGELALAACYFILPGPVFYEKGEFHPVDILPDGFANSPKMNRSFNFPDELSPFEFPDTDPDVRLARIYDHLCCRIRDLVKGKAMAWAEIERLQRLAWCIRVPGATIEASHAPFETSTWVCRHCGCYDACACVDENGESCHWVAPNLCSTCAEKG